MENRITIKIYEFAYVRLQELANLLTKEKGIPVNQIGAASIAIEEALARRQPSAALAEIREENAVRGD
jgi:hypothetical protein